MIADAILHTLTDTGSFGTTRPVHLGGGEGTPRSAPKELYASSSTASGVSRSALTTSSQLPPALTHVKKAGKAVDGRWSPQSTQLPNVARLVPTYGSVKFSPLRLECIYRGPGAFQLFLPEDAGADADSRTPLATLDEILQWYRDQIISLVIDASSLPNPKDRLEMAYPVDLPLSWIMSSDRLDADGHSDLMPILPELIELEVHTRRRVSLRSLLQFLQCTPVLRKLSIHNNLPHYPVYPERSDDLPKISLPYLQRVVVEGLFASIVNTILCKLTLSSATRVSVVLKPGFPSQHLSALGPLFSAVRHACLTYTALERRDDPARLRDRYRFTFSDVDQRVEVHWDWETEPGDPTTLFHVTLDPGAAALTSVRTLTVSLNHVIPSFSDWDTILSPFPSLQHMDLHTTLRPDTHDAQAEDPQPQPDPQASGCRTATFRVRGAALLAMVANVPLMFALGLTEHLDEAEAQGLRDDVPNIFGSLLKLKLYAAAWRHSVQRSMG